MRSVRHRPLPLQSRPVALAALALLGTACTEPADTPVVQGRPTPSGGTSPAVVVGAEALGTPRLLVYVVVDQLRADLLDRYDTVFTGGFARLRAEGLRFPNATFDHAQTSTAPGHGTASTGTHPRRHGLVGNSWLEEGEGGGWGSVYALRDLDSRVVGFPEMEGRGPANLQRSTLGEWMQAADSGSRVVSLSAKDRSAIAMAGRARAEVYWMEEALGRFVTASFYRNDDSPWVGDFHERVLPRIWSDTVWTQTVPEWARALSRPDTSRFEGDGVNTYFPHRAALEADLASARSVNRWRGRGPWPDVATLELGKVAVQALELGRRESPDLLLLALSQVDRVGHEYGPLSREQLDNLLRLDAALGDFLAFLDAEVGGDGWMLALTADHGVIELPEVRPAMGLPGRRIHPDELRAMVERAEAAAEAAGDDPLERARAAARAALEADWIDDAFAFADLLRDGPADTLQALFLHSWHEERRLPPLGHLGVGVRLVEGTYAGRYPTGTGHGSPYYYDRHVPFILRVPGIAPGANPTRVGVADLAPTLATLLGIPFPDDLDGRPVVRVEGR